MYLYVCRFSSKGCIWCKWCNRIYRPCTSIQIDCVHPNYLKSHLTPSPQTSFPCSVFYSVCIFVQSTLSFEPFFCNLNRVSHVYMFSCYWLRSTIIFFYFFFFGFGIYLLATDKNKQRKKTKIIVNCIWCVCVCVLFLYRKTLTPDEQDKSSVLSMLRGTEMERMLIGIFCNVFPMFIG